MIRARAKGWIMSTAILTRMIMGVSIVTITAVMVTLTVITMRITSMGIVTITTRRTKPVWMKPSPDGW